jgi:hypothetical protein
MRDAVFAAKWALTIIASAPTKVGQVRPGRSDLRPHLAQSVISGIFEHKVQRLGLGRRAAGEK